MWRGVSDTDRQAAVRILLATAALNLVGWGIFALAVLPHHFRSAGLGRPAGSRVVARGLDASRPVDGIQGFEGAVRHE